MHEKHSPEPKTTFEAQESVDAISKLGRVATHMMEQGERLGGMYEVLELDDAELSHALRRNYLRNTYRLTEKIQEEKPDYVIYLDKSGRPVAWLENELYDDFVNDPDNENDPWPKPQSIFLNIDREHWRDATGGKEYGSGQVDVNHVDQSVIDSLRSILLEQEPKAGAEIGELASMLDGKRVLIVDEVKFTGDTLKIAEKLLERAFPDATFTTHHWMTSPKAAVKDARSSGLPDVPVWYRQKAEWGRGVGNRSFDTARASTSWRQRNGAMFLSRRFEKPDEPSLQLRAEIKQLAREYRDGRYGSVVY